ncbi:MAG: type VI secretion system tube protein Hcp [Desulfobacterales bacterium]|nr:type VI secretion system tube protein Hcp [Desulfobacterales bacterium]
MPWPAATGTHIKEVKLELCRAGGDKIKYMEYKLLGCHHHLGTAGRLIPGRRERLPWRRCPSATARSNGPIRQPIAKTGKTSGDVKSNWDLTANKGA